MDLTKFAEIANIVSQALNADGKVKVAMLSDAYYQSVQENLKLTEEIAEKNATIRENNEEISRLNAIIERKEHLVRKGNAYYFKEPDNKLSGPICPNCYSRDDIVNYLTTGSKGAYCTLCKGSYPRVESDIKGPNRGIV